MKTYFIYIYEKNNENGNRRAQMHPLYAADDQDAINHTEKLMPDINTLEGFTLDSVHLREKGKVEILKNWWVGENKIVNPIPLIKIPLSNSTIF